MTNKVVFEVETESSYDADELQEFLQAFTEFVLNEDGLADPESTEIAYNPAKSNGVITDERKTEIFREVLGKATVVTTVSFDGENVAIIGE